MGDESGTPPRKPRNPRNDGSLWKPGQSGNPAGRPPVLADVRELARQYSALAIETLAELCQSADRDAARVAAATALLDRAYGKPAQSLEVAHTGDPPLVAARKQAEAWLRDPVSAAALLALAELPGTDDPPS